MVKFKILKATKTAAVAILKAAITMSEAKDTVGFKGYAEEACSKITQHQTDTSKLTGTELGCLLDVKVDNLDALVNGPEELCGSIDLELPSKETFEGVNGLRQIIDAYWGAAIMSFNHDFSCEQTTADIITGSCFNQMERDGILKQKLNFLNGSGRFKNGVRITITFHRIEFKEDDLMSVSLGTIVLISVKTSDDFQIVESSLKLLGQYRLINKRKSLPEFNDVDEWLKYSHNLDEIESKLRAKLKEACRALRAGKSFGEALTIETEAKDIGIDITGRG